MSEPVDLYTIIVIVSFLMILIVGAYFLRTRKDQIQAHFNKDQKMKILNTLMLGLGHKAVLFEVHQQEFLIIVGKNQSSIIQPINSITSSNNKTYKNLEETNA